MKYFIKDSDKEVQMGQTIEVEQKVNTSLGEGVCKTQVYVTPKNIGLLVKQGFLVQKDEEEEIREKELAKAKKRSRRRGGKGKKKAADAS
jgi:hypothetical protein